MFHVRVLLHGELGELVLCIVGDRVEHELVIDLAAVPKYESDLLADFNSIWVGS